MAGLSPPNLAQKWKTFQLFIANYVTFKALCISWWKGPQKHKINKWQLVVRPCIIVVKLYHVWRSSGADSRSKENRQEKLLPKQFCLQIQRQIALLRSNHVTACIRKCRFTRFPSKQLLLVESRLRFPLKKKTRSSLRFSFSLLHRRVQE